MLSVDDLPPISRTVLTVCSWSDRTKAKTFKASLGTLYRPSMTIQYKFVACLCICKWTVMIWSAVKKDMDVTHMLERVTVKLFSATTLWTILPRKNKTSHTSEYRGSHCPCLPSRPTQCAAGGGQALALGRGGFLTVDTVPIFVSFRWIKLACTQHHVPHGTFHTALADVGDNRKRTTQHGTEPNCTGDLPAGWTVKPQKQLQAVMHCLRTALAAMICAWLSQLRHAHSSDNASCPLHLSWQCLQSNSAAKWQ